MFRRILVPLDFTDKSTVALDMAIQFAGPSQAGVTLLHVIETVEHLPFEDLRGFYGKLEEEAHARLRLRLGMFEEKALEVEHDVVYGRRAEEIVRYALEKEMDLIILSSHRIEPGRPSPAWGTISYQVAIMAQCPVLLVK